MALLFCITIAWPFNYQRTVHFFPRLAENLNNEHALGIIFNTKVEKMKSVRQLSDAFYIFR
ncbi:MAG: hypothetical protein C4540_00685 [Candidatus Omnitrophota bacterium]|nr:MAG: hypothetical protein C4540_00685 [Candidatus Omnitrophota bacterium]